MHILHTPMWADDVCGSFAGNRGNRWEYTHEHVGEVVTKGCQS